MSRPTVVIRRTSQTSPAGIRRGLVAAAGRKDQVAILGGEEGSATAGSAAASPVSQVGGSPGMQYSHPPKCGKDILWILKSLHKRLPPPFPPRNPSDRKST